MPTVTLNKKRLIELAGLRLNDTQLDDRISMLGIVVDALTNTELTLDVAPNRPDLLSESGLARALSSFMNKKTGLKNYKVEKSKEKVIIDKSVSKVRPYTPCAIIKGLKFDDETLKEVIQLQEKLHVTFGRNRKKCAIGIYPLEKIKMPIRYLAKKPSEIKFKPLDSLREMSAAEILADHPKGKEYAALLAGKEVYPLFMDSANNVLSMPPIINSELTGRVTEKTKDVFIECSGFDYRILSLCLNMIVSALADLGGKIYSMELVYDNKKILSPDLTARKVKFEPSYVNKRLGLELKEPEIKKCLEMMGFGYEKNTALVPAYRTDILHQIDLAEDIAIAYGYENFKEIIPNVATIGQEDRFEIFKDKVANVLVGLSFLEVNTYDISSKESQADKMNLTNKSLIELENPMNKDYNVLREWVTPSLMEVFSRNIHNDYPQKIFGIGRVFKLDLSTETGVLEADRIAVAISESSSDYTKIKQVLDALFLALGMQCEVKEAQHQSFIPGRVARISVKGKDVAYIGEIHPKVLSNFGLQMPVSAFELNLTELYKLF